MKKNHLMESRVFKAACPSTRLVILDLFREQKLAVYLEFTKDAHAYFRQKYPNEYEYFLLNAEKNFCFVSRIDSIRKPQSKFTVTLLEYSRSDAETHDDSCYVVTTTPSNNKGYVLEIPIVLINGANISPLKIK